ncbi:MAG: hypothetical protein GY719_36790 [bacterium]|nr:hypothetical protein [bacterium]
MTSLGDDLGERIPSSSSSEESSGRLLPFRRRRSEETDLYGDAGISYQSVYETRRRGVQRPERDLPSEAILLIDAAADNDYSKVERSNSFDSWRSTLRTLAKSSLGRNVYYRQILGGMVLATNKKDMVDFSSEALKVFREATVVIGSPGTSELDSRHVLSKLKDADLLAPAPMYSEEDVASLDEQIDHWLAKSKHNA